MKFNFKKPKNGKAFSIHIWKNGVPSFINPVRDWTAGLIVAVVILSGGIAFITYDFYNQFEAPTRAVVTEAQPVVYQEAEIVRYAEIYEEKERVFNALRAERGFRVEPAQEKRVESPTVAEETVSDGVPIAD